jgi:hypothetical protein
MGCFCHASLVPLAVQLPALDVAVSVELSGAELAMALAAWLAARGLPAAPWQPDPAWLGLQLPVPRLQASAIATISALVQLRAQVLAQFGLDLLVPAQASGFARIVATMNARFSASAMAAINPAGWVQLATLNGAIDQVRLALNAGLLVPSAPLLLALTMPGGVAMPQWAGLLGLLRLLAPLIAASLQLGASVSATAELAAALRVLARLSLPPLAAPALMASLTAALSATASLQASLGIAPLQLGLPQVRLLVLAKLEALLALLAATFNIAIPGLGGAPVLPGAIAALIAMLLAMLPKLPVVPSSMATAEVVQMAMQAEALAAVSWQVPLSLPSIQIGLSTCALVAQLQASLSLTAVLPSPCGSGCDAASLLRAFQAA